MDKFYAITDFLACYFFRQINQTIIIIWVSVDRKKKNIGERGYTNLLLIF